ncbi:MAG TPA: c-type cytochrome, partial [Terriglobales bacterium]
CSLQAQPATSRASAFPNDARVAAVSGESWLTHLNRSFGDTSMGKTGRLGPGPQEEDALQPPPQRPIYSSRDGIKLHGSDLYRLNCQGCHGESGLGAPPEINSVINPVRATSVALVVARMKERGMDISYADASNLAQQSKAALLERVHKGGENMPSFPQLSETEIPALLAYLNHLAVVPGYASDSLVVKESHVRVGELIVKSTCHICHSAIGPNPGPQQLMDGAIPPLSTLTARKNQSEFVRKVTQGAPVLMGTPAMLCRGRMPVFFYLTDEEAADVYQYLRLYPPTEQSPDGPLVAAFMAVTSHSGRRPASPLPTHGSASGAAEAAESERDAEIEKAAVSITATMVAFALVGGLVFTFREFKRLSPEITSHAGRDVPADSGTPGHPQAGYHSAPLFFDAAKRSSQ